MQKEGIQYKATNVLYSQNAVGVSVSMDIAAAYPADAAVKKYERKFDFNQSKNTIQLFENYELLEWKSPLVQSFLVAIKPTMEKPGQLLFALLKGGYLAFNYDTTLFDIAIEDKILEKLPIIQRQRRLSNNENIQVGLNKEPDTKSKSFDIGGMLKMADKFGVIPGGKQGDANNLGLGKVMELMQKLNTTETQADADALKQEMDSFLQKELGVDVEKLNTQLEQVTQQMNNFPT
jgi:hypothetical protein